MSLDFARTFGQGSAQPSTDRKELPKANIWMNIGYNVASKDADGNDVDMFVALPVGIPIDTMEPKAVTSRNPGFAAFQSASNDLLAQVQEAAANLKPGEDTIVNLQIQLRRVSDAVVAPSTDENPFARKLDLVG